MSLPAGPHDPDGIVLDGVMQAFDETTVLHETSVRIPERRVAIVGRNGSGKTTLMRLIAGLSKPSQGRVTIDGVDVARDRKAAIRTVGLLFQNPDQQIIFPTVGEELAFGLRQIGHSKSAARAASQAILAQYDRADWIDKSVSTLSQGQRQLVCLMAVLLMEPKVILLDEPFSGLDIPTTRALTRHLAGLEARLVQITHAPADLQGYERMIWLERGRVHQDGPVDQVLPLFTAAMNAEDGTTDEERDAGSDLVN